MTVLICNLCNNAEHYLEYYSELDVRCVSDHLPVTPITLVTEASTLLSHLPAQTSFTVPSLAMSRVIGVSDSLYLRRTSLEIIAVGKVIPGG